MNMMIAMSSFSENSVFKLFSVPLKRDAGISKFLRFEKRFEKLCFRDGLVLTLG